MRIIAGYHPATSGTAEVAGHEVHRHPLEVKRRVGYLPERVPLYDEMTVHAYLRYVATLKGLRGAELRGEIGRVLAQCGLEPMVARIVRNLSKGYRQRVGIAQALLGNPPVLILDEPTVGLDPTQMIEVRRFIRSLAPAHTVLLSTHVLPEVAVICERVIIINHGRIAADEAVTRDAQGLEAVFMRAVAPGMALEEA